MTIQFITFDAFMGSNIAIPRLEEAVYNGRDTIVPINTRNKEYNIVIYYDSVTCSSCELSELWKWKAFMDEDLREKANCLFIFSPSTINEDEIRTYLNLYPFPWPVYIDTDNLFANGNKNILPSEKIFHTFMLDKEDNVTLIGNPIKSYELKKLYEETLTNRDENLE